MGHSDPSVTLREYGHFRASTAATTLGEVVELAVGQVQDTHRTQQDTKQRSEAASGSSWKTTAMDRRRAIGQLRADCRRVQELITDDNLPKPVATCPDWDFGGLVTHLARVYNFAGTIVLERLEAPPVPGSLPPRPEDMPLKEYLIERADRLVAALAEVPAEERVWNFSPEPDVASFWWRRQMHETIIHRIDAELAAGVEVTGVAPELASDTLSEVLMLLGLEVSEPDESGIDAGDALTIHFHSTDVEPDNALGAWNEWFVDTAKNAVSRQHRKATTAIRGPALELARWQWGRGGSAEILGGVEAATAWRRSVAR